MRSATRIWATRSSTLVKSSMPIWTIPGIAGSAGADSAATGVEALDAGKDGGTCGSGAGVIVASGIGSALAADGGAVPSLITGDSLGVLSFSGSLAAGAAI